MLRTAFVLLIAALVFATFQAPVHSTPAQQDWGPEIADLLHMGRQGPCGCPRL